MDIFSWLIFGPFFSLIAVVVFGVALLYFILGLQNFMAGKKEKSNIKIRSGYTSLFVSGLIAIATFIAWIYLGGFYYIFWWTKS
jgi:uncharacterized membrane protein